MVRCDIEHWFGTFTPLKTSMEPNSGQNPNFRWNMMKLHILWASTACFQGGRVISTCQTIWFGHWAPKAAQPRALTALDLLPLLKIRGDCRGFDMIPHDGSMVLVYMLTWLGYIDGIHVAIYSSTMDPMGTGRNQLKWLAEKYIRRFFPEILIIYNVNPGEIAPDCEVGWLSPSPK